MEPSKSKLSEVLLKRQEGALLRVNFHPKLTRLLREVKYMMLQGLSVPPAAKAVHERAEIYRVQVSSLEIICDQYNRVSLGLPRGGHNSNVPCIAISHMWLGPLKERA